MSVLVALEVVSSQQAVLELRHVTRRARHAISGADLAIRPKSCSRLQRMLSVAAVECIECDFLFHICLYYDDCSGHVECDADTISRTNRSSCLELWSTSMFQRKPELAGYKQSTYRRILVAVVYLTVL